MGPKKALGAESGSRKQTKVTLNWSWIGGKEVQRKGASFPPRRTELTFHVCQRRIWGTCWVGVSLHHQLYHQSENNKSNRVRLGRLKQLQVFSKNQSTLGQQKTRNIVTPHFSPSSSTWEMERLFLLLNPSAPSCSLLLSRGFHDSSDGGKTRWQQGLQWMKEG